MCSWGSGCSVVNFFDFFNRHTLVECSSEIYMFIGSILNKLDRVVVLTMGPKFVSGVELRVMFCTFSVLDESK